MSQQRKRHFERQPIEETVHAAISDLVSGEGSVEVERHAYGWRADDLLVWVHLKNLMSDAVLELFRQRLVEKMYALLPPGQPLGDWLVVIKYGSETLGTVNGRGGVGEAN
ncbi:MAG: hypothetical protein FWC42_07635 [Proteobacteria bacterium]|nr:hypothetical protein [Pseudomonadota bacterium]